MLKFQSFSFILCSTLKPSGMLLQAPSSTLHVCQRRRNWLSCSAATSNLARLRLEIKTIAGEDRGIFGMEDNDRDVMDKLICAVERDNPTKNPTLENAKAAAGSWRLLYTNLEILGRKRVRLAIGTSKKPGFVQLGEFIQVIDPLRKQSKNIVEFKVMTGTSGTFAIVANYDVISQSRVNVSMIESRLEPESLERLLGDNQSLLTQIFNPDGHLDITYVDESLRIGRDNKGYVFVLEKMQDAKQ